MSRFRICLDRVLKHEGGFVNHPKDPGGATNFGITQATLADFRKKPVTVAEVKSMTKDEAGEIYRWRYWSPPLCEALPEGVDYMVFDLAVNSGVSRAVKFLQLTVGATPDEFWCIAGCEVPATHGWGHARRQGRTGNAEGGFVHASARDHREDERPAQGVLPLSLHLPVIWPGMASTT